MLHNVPLIMVCLVSVLYQCGTILFYPCEEVFVYTVQVCGGACYQFQPIISTIDVLVTVYTPIFLITFFTAALIIRVLYQKRRMQQKNRWKKNYAC